MTLAPLWLDSKRMAWSLFKWNRFYGTFYSKTLITTKPTSNISSFGSLSVQIISCIIRLRMALFVSSKRFYRMVRQYFRPCACRVMAQKDKASIRIQDRHCRYGSFPIGGPQGHAVRNSNMLDNYDGSWPPWSDWVCLPEAEVAPLALSRRAAPAMDREYKDIFPSKRFPGQYIGLHKGCHNPCHWCHTLASNLLCKCNHDAKRCHYTVAKSTKKGASLELGPSESWLFGLRNSRGCTWCQGQDWS